MALLSQQLKNIASRAQAAATSQQRAGEASNIFQTQQAIGEVLRKPGAQSVDATALAQQMAPAITQQQGAVALQAQQQQGAQLLQAGQAAAQQQQQQAAQRLESERLATEKEIAEKQLEGKLKQNSLELEKSKRMQARDIEQQKRFRQTGYEFDNRISFLTRKQREDLAGLGSFLKQQIFDSRLQFSQDEQGRKFSNERQLADYAVLSAENEIQLGQHLRDMQEAHEKEMIVLEAAYTKLSQQMKFQFEKQETQRDQQLTKSLVAQRNAIREKMRRKQANQAMWTNYIKGTAIIVAAVAATVASAGAATPVAIAAVSTASAAAGGAADVATAAAAEGGAFD